ncbi:MAG: hypothetical protein KAH32_01955 [Chlamydiia bacterium]|nr:hypothetical protein [Chlamydiia bacterium]
MNNISKNIYALFSKGKNLNKTTMTAAIACVIFIVFVGIRGAISVKNALLKVASRINKYKFSWTDICGPSDFRQVGKYKFPEKDNKYENVMTYLTHSGKFDSDSKRKKPELYETRNSIASVAVAHCFSINNQDFKVIRTGGALGSETLFQEMSGSLYAESYIEDNSLRNIEIPSRILYDSLDEYSRTELLVRKSPDMKADKSIRERGLLQDRMKCKIAAESLVELAGEFIFTVPDHNPKYSSEDFHTIYSKQLTKYRDARDNFDKDNTVDISKYNLTAEKLLGKDCFTLSEDAKGNLKVNVMLTLKLDDPLIEPTLLGDPREALIANYTTIFTVFPYSAYDMLRAVDKKGKCSLTDDDKKFLREVAESAKDLT